MATKIKSSGIEFNRFLFFSYFRFLMSINRYPRTTTDVLSLRFNQDSSIDQWKHDLEEFFRFLFLGCFICATCDGIRIFNLEPFAQKSFLGNLKNEEFYTITFILFRCRTSDLCRNALSDKFDCICTCRSRDWFTIECWYGKDSFGFWRYIELFRFLVNVYDDERKTHVLELCFSLSVVSIRMSRTRWDYMKEILYLNEFLFLLQTYCCTCQQNSYILFS